MDFVNKFAGGSNSNEQQQTGQTGQSVNEQVANDKSSGGGFLGGIGDKLNSAAGGGKESEKNEDYLDKGVDFVQEKFLGQGAQDNESAVEQAKDEQISDFLRGQYKTTTGSDIPIKDKETRFG
ncbi:Nn.00g099050.m01.CDS01 [Neocucurbitaria sp. VM-36]